MMDFHSLASTRRSIRKYTDEDVGVEAILECIDTAVTAPSGCNSQCWKFVVIHNPEMLERLAAALSDKLAELIDSLGLKDDGTYLESKIKMATFFKKAPVCVAVFMTKLDYYDKKMESGFLDKGYSPEEVMDLLSNPDTLSIGAAIQNLLLAAHERGLGACWMNEPILAKDSISAILGMAPEDKLMSLIPIGHPAYQPKAKHYKPISEIVKVIE